MPPLLAAAVAHGLILAIMVTATMRISGHLNPAVTIGFLVTKRIEPMMAVIYIIAQLLGAMLAAYALKALFPASVAAATRLGGQAMAVDVTHRVRRSSLEAIATFFLVFVVFGTAVDPHAPKVGGFAIGLTVDGGHPGDRHAHRRVDESGAVVRPGGGERAVRGAGGVLDRPDPRRDRGGAAVRHALPASRRRTVRPRSRGAERYDAVRELRQSDRSTALRRGVLFIVATSPIWLVPQRFPVFHPVAMLGVVLGATLLFLWWDKRSPSELGLELSWRPVPRTCSADCSAARC